MSAIDYEPGFEPLAEKAARLEAEQKTAALEEKLRGAIRETEKRAAEIKAERYAGPELVYSHTTGHGDRAHQRIDLEPLADPRERAICRALLLHALALLDASEPARRNTGGIAR